jgi:hypothetical protein
MFIKYPKGFEFLFDFAVSLVSLVFIYLFIVHKVSFALKYDIWQTTAS